MRRVSLLSLPLLAFTVACSQPAAPAADGSAAAAPSASAAKLGIRPLGETETPPDLSQVPPDVQKVFAHIDENVDQHVVNLQEWIQQPSISNSGEGIPESAEMVKGFFDELGCQQTQVYDVGITEYGTPGNPVVYAKCDEGAEKTLLIYWMYDTMPVTQPDAWEHPPFEGQIVQHGAFPKVMFGRGATNSKGPQMVQLNAFRAIKAVHGKLPVNLIFVAEGDEERMDIGLRKWVKDHPELLEGADAMIRFGSQSTSGNGGFGGGSEGCVYVELTTSGTAWGRGPTVSDIHGSNKRGTDSPAWRHIKMLASLVSDDGNTPLIDGFFDGIEPLSAEQEQSLRAGAKNMNLKTAAENLGVARFMFDDPYQVLKTTALRHVVQPRRDLGRQHVCGRRRRHPAQQDHLEAQLPLRAEHEGPGHRQEAARPARQERLQGRRGEADRRRAVGADELRPPRGSGDEAGLRGHGIPHGQLRATGASAVAARRPAATGRRTCSATGEVGEKVSPYKGVPDHQWWWRAQRPR